MVLLVSFSHPLNPTVLVRSRGLRVSLQLRHRYFIMVYTYKYIYCFELIIESNKVLNCIRGILYLYSSGHTNLTLFHFLSYPFRNSQAPSLPHNHTNWWWALSDTLIPPHTDQSIISSEYTHTFPAKDGQGETATRALLSFNCLLSSPRPPLRRALQKHTV